MKSLILLLVFELCIIKVNAQVIGQVVADSPQIENEVKSTGFEYEEVLPVNLSKAVLWINLKKWVSSNFSSYKHVVDMEDKDAGILIVKWNSNKENPYSSHWSAQYEATYQIDVRENKYRIKIYNSTARLKPSDEDYKYMSTESLKQAQKELETIMAICESLQGTSTLNLDNQYLKVMESNSRYEPIMRAVKDSYMTFNSYVLKSLKEAMIKTDDF